jgi:membrane protein DedA with SNARE-associated domain
MYIGAGVASFAIAVALGISLMSNPDFSRGDVSALFSIACVLVVSVSLLWIRYVQK